MKIQILPNWCKKLGLILFLITSFITSGDAAINGYNHGYNAGRGYSQVIKNKSTLFLSYFGENFLHIFDILAIIGILIYMLSKEKVEDDYINKLRLESYQLTAIIGLIISILLYVFSKDLKLTLDYFIYLYLWFYIIIFSIKKRIDL